MNLLLDTHLLFWAAGSDPRMSAEAAALIDDDANLLPISAASIW